jgi:alanine racemase
MQHHHNIHQLHNHDTTRLVFSTIPSFDLNSIDQSVYAVMKIDLDATVENYRLLKNLSSPGVCGAVVKADAYGVGATAISSTLIREGCCDYFVAYLDEALAIKPYLPPYARIFVLNGYFPSLEKEFFQNGFIPVLHNTEQFDRFKNFCQSLHTKQPYVLHIDTGMHRTGLSLSQVQHLVELNAFEKFQPLMIMSHLSSAEHQSSDANREHKQIFDEVSGYFPMSLKSFSNSSGIFLGQDYTYDLTRPGLALHGFNPTLNTNPMTPVINLYARIVQIGDLPKDQYVGYNRTFKANKPSRIATLSIGYADGIPWRLSNQSHVRINGQKAPIVGRISMDLVTVDVTDIDHINLYDFAELTHETQTVDDWGALSEQLIYELLLSIGPRFKRYYTKSK